MAEPRITLLVRDGCHLCAYAREALERVRAATGERWIERDVAADPELEREYGDRIPVLLLDGREYDHFRVDEERLRRDLAAPVDAGRVLSRSRHLVWDWNGTLLDDLPLVVAATNAACASVGGPAVTAEEHRRDFRRPVRDYYARLLGRPVDEAEFARLDRIFHDAYQAGLATCRLAADAVSALRAWVGSQSLLSMWFHTDLLPVVGRLGLAPHFVRVDGLRDAIGGGPKHPHLVRHLTALGLSGEDVVLIGDTVDDAHAAAAVGADCVLYAGGFTEARQLRATGVPVVDSLTEAVTLAAGG